MRAYIGTSGFYYEDWKGVFYPEDLSKSKYLDFYIQNFDTVELNSVFYHLPKQKSVENWAKKASSDFLYSLKAYRGITHYKKLKDAKEELYLFLHLIKPLKSHTGMILFQLPPSLKKDINLLADFLSLLPESFNYAFEFRDKSWYEDDVYELLKRYDIAFCIHDFGKKKTPVIETSKNIYIRFHGPSGYYRGSYEDDYLKEWAKKIKEFLKRNRRVFCYFNNDFPAFAVKNAKTLIFYLNEITKEQL